MKLAKSILNALHQPLLVLGGTLWTRITYPVFFRAFGFEPSDSEADFIAAFVPGVRAATPGDTR
jgi:hypothetical protein